MPGRKRNAPKTEKEVGRLSLQIDAELLEAFREKLAKETEWTPSAFVRLKIKEFMRTEQ